MRKNTVSVPLIVEPHPENYSGYPFITLIQYNDQNLLAIMDNIIGGNITGYVLDLCTPSGVSENAIIEAAINWYDSGRYTRIPVSIEFSRLGVAETVNRIYRAFPMDFVTRVIGPLPEYKMSGVLKVKKRKKKQLKGIQFIDRVKCSLES